MEEAGSADKRGRETRRVDWKEKTAPERGCCTSDQKHCEGDRAWGWGGHVCSSPLLLFIGLFLRG